MRRDSPAGPCRLAEALAAAGSPAGPDLRLSVEEVAEFLTTAWQAATQTRPAVIAGNSEDVLWARITSKYLGNG